VLFESCAAALDGIVNLEALPALPEREHRAEHLAAFLLCIAEPFALGMAALSSIRRAKPLLPVVVLAAVAAFGSTYLPTSPWRAPSLGPVDPPLEVKDLSIETQAAPGGMQVAADLATARRLPFDQWIRRHEIELAVQLPRGGPITVRARLVPWFAARARRVHTLRRGVLGGSPGRERAFSPLLGGSSTPDAAPTPMSLEKNAYRL